MRISYYFQNAIERESATTGRVRLYKYLCWFQNEYEQYETGQHVQYERDDEKRNGWYGHVWYEYEYAGI
jgi:hypothetical protein